MGQGTRLPKGLPWNFSRAAKRITFRSPGLDGVPLYRRLFRPGRNLNEAGPRGRRLGFESGIAFWRQPRGPTNPRPRTLLVAVSTSFVAEGRFSATSSTDRSAENLLGEALTKWVLSSTERIIALRDLEAMNITARNLFRDFEGAARSAITWLRLEGEEHRRKF